jgi:hypothetical protein
MVEFVCLLYPDVKSEEGLKTMLGTLHDNKKSFGQLSMKE